MCPDGRGEGSYTRMLTRLAKFDPLAIDDWMLPPFFDAERRDLPEVIEECAERASTFHRQPVCPSLTGTPLSETRTRRAPS